MSGSEAFTILALSNAWQINNAQDHTHKKKPSIFMRLNFFHVCMGDFQHAGTHPLLLHDIMGSIYGNFDLRQGFRERICTV